MDYPWIEQLTSFLACFRHLYTGVVEPETPEQVGQIVSEHERLEV